MRQIAPSGPIYQAGTLSGNPVAMAAGLATLELIQAPGFHEKLEANTHALCDGLEAAAREAGIAFVFVNQGETPAAVRGYLARLGRPLREVPDFFTLDARFYDVNGDGADEILAASGPGRPGEIRVYTRDGVELPAYRTQPFGRSYIGGVEVAAGDVDGNGTVDIVAVASIGRGTTSVFRVNPTAFDPVENVPFRSFVAFDHRTRAGGTVAVADLNNDGRAEIIRGSGSGSAPRVNIYDLTVTSRLVDSFVPFAGLRRYTGGVSVSTTWFNADSTPDIIVAGGQGAGSVIEVYDGTINARAANARLDTARMAAFADLASRNTAVFAAAIDLDGDGIADQILATQGEGGSNHGIRGIGENLTMTNMPVMTRSNLRIVSSMPKRSR
jgi:hypothetical protein